MARKKSVNDLFGELAKAESDFLSREFFAPVLRGHGVQVRMASVRCQLEVEPADFEGWGVFQPLSHSKAKFVRRGTMGERQRYLALFPVVPLLLCRYESSGWLAIAANGGDKRFQFEGLAPLRLTDEADLFDTVVARFDGSQFWFEAVDGRVDPSIASYLRESLHKMDAPNALQRKGLSAQHETAYKLIYAARMEKLLADERERGEHRLRAALKHAGAELRDYAERGDFFRVTYTVDGRTHTSAINKNDLSVQSAGICLSGQDQNFDLASLIGVLREAEDNY